ncbi:choice-of-anchor A family protein [Butyrivibrio sp. AC2005]|uniref:choice-of-anchor A family protein n=1 Tax=Butyrivibrio sp. AC2005 TaxID=1280672 RepID=UPI0003F7C8CB|nr:FctA domain-containing protein [Butyrivibrio sp. AC2005]
MRKLDNKRIEEYLKKHVSLKKWVSIMLVVALLVTTATMYSLNKSANALSGDEAEDVGMVLEGENIEELASGNDEAGDTDSIQDSEESESTEGSEEESSESENTESENSENSETENAESENSETENSGSENSEESANAEATSEESNSGEASTEESAENNTESTEGSEANAENANSEEGATDQTTTGETTDVADASTETSTEDGENTDAATKGDSKKDSNEVELTEDVVLTVSYVTEDGEKIADEKEINLSESLDFTTEAPKQEGYEFKKAEIDGVEINKITAKQDANGHKYYEVTVGRSVTESEETTSTENTVDGEFTDRSATDETLSETTASEDTAAESTSSESEPSENTAEELTSEDSSSSETASSESSSSDASSEDSSSDNTATEENSSNDAVSEEDTSSETTSEEASSTVSLTEAAEGDVVVIKENKTVVLTYKSDKPTKTEYVYEDAKVRVTATLEYADAVPDDAEFIVKEITTETEGYNYDAYMKALNDGEEQSIKNHNAMNTILYDVGFFVNKTDEEGNVIEGEKVEYQPKEGSVNVKFEFLDNQMSNLRENTESESEIEINHLPLSESVKESTDSTSEATNIDATDIQKEKVGTVNTSSGENAEISVTNFSVFGFSPAAEDKDTYTYKSGDKTLIYKVNREKDAFRNSKYFDDSLVLGVAGNFHIVAFDTANLNAHTNGNVLAKNLNAGSNFGTNNMENELSYAQNITTVNENMASSESHTLAVGNSLNVDLYKNENGQVEPYFSISGKKVAHPSNIIQDADTASAPYIDLEGVKSEVQAISNKMAEVKENVDVSITEDGSHKTITYTGIGGAGYLNFTSAQWNSFASGNRLDYVFPNDYEQQAIIINIDCSGNDGILHPNQANVIKVNNQELSTKEEKDVKAGRVVYNFYNASGKEFFLNDIFGQVIALGAKVTITNGNGNFIADTVTIKGETHRRDFIGTTEKGAVVSIKAKKTVNGNEPSADQVYTFKAERLYSSGQTVTGTNKGSDISIDVSELIDDKEGQYYILLTEEKGTDTSIGYDGTRYLAIIDIKSKKDGNKTIYYADSVKYCTEGWNEIDADKVVFNNTINEEPVKIKAEKYVDGSLAGSDTTGKFSFTLRMLDSDEKSWKKDANGNVKTATITNTGSEISYDISPAEWGMTYGWDSTKASDKDYQKQHTYYFMLTEKDVDGYAKDSSGILIKIKHYLNGEVNYYRITSDEVKTMESNPGTGLYNDPNRIQDSNSKTDIKYHNVAFYNTTGGGMLRIHKMVINDFGSDLVRDSDDAILSKVTFRVTNVSTKKYIIVHGFTGKAGRKEPAYEYLSNGSATGKKYDVIYNQGAQWTIVGLDAGSYTVEEVGDGISFDYYEESNTSSLRTDSKWSRVTKYYVTVDKEIIEQRSKTLDYFTMLYGTGGNNQRVVFSADLTPTGGDPDQYHLNVCPTAVVGDESVDNISHTQTVQVCNYYSIPVGPIKVTKKFTGGTWTKDMKFTFKIEPVSCIALNSEGKEIPGVSVPMPATTTVTLDAPTNVENKSVSSAVANFGGIVFRYEGTYFYKITEENTGIDGIKYDTNVYYVKIVVDKLRTTAMKRYSSDKMTDLAVHKGEDEIVPLRDDFYYLHSNITYTDVKGEVKAQYELYLPELETVGEKFPSEFLVKELKGSIDDVVFNNSIAGKLTAKKVWLDSDGTVDTRDHSPLTIYINRRIEGGNWEEYGTAQLSKDNGWTKEIGDLPIMDENGNNYEYCVKESDDYMNNYAVTYTYNGNTYNAPNKDEMAAYKMTAQDKNYGEVVITNKYLFGYVLPSTGGAGNMPFIVFGLGLLAIGISGVILFRKKKEN